MRFIRFVIPLLAMACASCGGSAIGSQSSGSDDTDAVDAASETAADSDSSPEAAFDSAVVADAAGSDAGFDADASPVTPILEFAFEGPASHDAYMGEEAQVFCFSLHAQGASFDVALPISEIHGIADADVHTDSLWGTVFGTGVIWEGTDPVSYTGMVSPTPDAIVFDNLPYEIFTVAQDATRHLCLDVDVTDWSHTPDTFYGKQYVFEMGDWPEGSVRFAGTEQPLPRSQIIAPSKVTGNPVRILSKDGNTHPERYSGTLDVTLDPNNPAGLNVFPGDYVDTVTFRFIADAKGSCLRNIIVTDTGSFADDDIDLVLFKNEPQSGGQVTIDAGSVQLSAKTWDIGYPNGGFLFCLEGGQSVSATVTMYLSSTASTPSTHQFSLWSVPTDVVVVQGGVTGSYPVMGNMFTVIPPP